MRKGYDGWVVTGEERCRGGLERDVAVELAVFCAAQTHLDVPSSIIIFLDQDRRLATILYLCLAAFITYCGMDHRDGEKALRERDRDTHREKQI